ncbi:MAG: hypothetical protein GIW97_01030 [Candidatus Eremiobacteraeota bacterium]|nr:hypothetical protein [Candidatus Eremiobacteraeota bacterium]
MKHALILAAFMSSIFFTAPGTAIADEFTDQVCPAATPVGRELDAVLRAQPVSESDLFATETKLADVYMSCAADYKLRGGDEAMHWAEFRYAKLRLLLGDAELKKSHVPAARADYLEAFNAADEIAKYEGGGLQVSGNNNIGSASSSHGSNQFSQFRDIAIQLREIAKKALDDLPKP